MSRASRLGWPLLLAIMFGGLHWFVLESPRLVEQLQLDRDFAENTTRFLAVIPLIFFFVRLLDLVAFDLFSHGRSVRAPVLLREIVSIVLFAILLAWAISSIFDTKITAVLATGTVLAAVLGLALQDTLGNLFSGIALHLEDSFVVGDVVRSGDQFGVVEAIRWRGTRIRTFNNSVLIVPNSMLARDRLEIFPRNNLNARVLQFNLDFNVPPASVLMILTQAAAHVDGVSNQVPAFARVGGFGESGLTYEIKYHTVDYSQRDRIDSEIRKAVWYAMRRNGIPLAYPMRNMRRYEAPSGSGQPDAGEIAERLGHVDILTPLSSDEHRSIAGVARVHTFSKGETILTHATSGNSMFIVHRGIVSVLVDESEVARLGEGDFFGEMALLTGEHRTADVVALSDAVVIEITKEALQPVLQNHPELVGAISTKVTERRGSLESIRAASHEEAHQTVLSRIRAYFGL